MAQACRPSSNRKKHQSKTASPLCELAIAVDNEAKVKLALVQLL